MPVAFVLLMPPGQLIGGDAARAVLLGGDRRHGHDPEYEDDTRHAAPVAASMHSKCGRVNPDACTQYGRAAILRAMAERPFAGKVALVTGGSRGIGRACALTFASLGAGVAINYSRSAKDAERAARDAAALGVRAVTLQADMADRDQIVAMFARVRAEFGRLDVLVNNAARGLERPRGAIDSLPKHLQHTMDVNLFGPWFCAQEAAKLISGGGAIVNLLSPGSQRYLPRYAPVGVSKGALASLTTYLAVELAPRGIRVNGVAAGLVEGTDGVRALPAEAVERYRNLAPARRLVRPEEVAEAVAFLCSDAASMIIGHVLLVDGGYSLLGMA